MSISTYSLAGGAIAIATFYLLRQRRQHKKRRHQVPDERVLILGASSGVGHAIARQYAQQPAGTRGGRNARICVVARRADKLQALVAECGGGGGDAQRCLGLVADMTVVEDMVRVRDEIAAQWGGLDTIHVCAGVSALQPIMALTGRTAEAAEEAADAAAGGIQTAVEIAGKAVQGNFVGPLVAALTFVRTKRHPPAAYLLYRCQAHY